MYLASGYCKYHGYDEGSMDVVEYHYNQHLGLLLIYELPDTVKQKFYKGSSKARGSGIGLAVCDEIVQRHGGVFDIGNADGGGAIVTIRLPISGQEL